VKSSADIHRIARSTGEAPARRGAGVSSGASRPSGFTFVEILVALAFIGLVIPVAMQAITISSKAGTFASRKATAVRLGDALLQELAVTDQWRSGSQSGQFEEPYQDFRWQIQSQAWTEQGMTELSLKVEFLVQDQPYNVVITTLVPEQEETQ